MASTRTTTIPTWPPASRVPDAARAAAFLAAVLLLEAVLARGLVGADTGLSRPILLLAGVAAVALVFRFPLATAFVLFGLTDFLFYPTFFAFEFGPMSVRPHELALAGLLALALIRPRRQTWGGGGGIALAAFLAILAAAAALAVLDRGAPATDVVNWGRPFAMLTLFYVIVRLFPEPERRRKLLAGAAVLAGLCGVVALAVALGAGVGDALKGPSEAIVKQEEGAAGLLRVRLAGLSAAYALFWYVVVQVAATHGGRRFGWSLALAGMALAIAISFNRNMWIGLIAGLGLMLVVGGPLVRNRLVAALAVSVAAIALLASFGSATESRVLEPVVQRGSTLFNPKGVEASRSLSDRERETNIAWPVAQDNLLLGVGPGVDFGVYSFEYAGPHSIKVEAQLFLHNQYLYLLLICGIPGLLAFLAFLAFPVLRSFRRQPIDPSITACGVGIAMIAISSIVAIYFSVEDMTTMLGLLTGVIVADFESRSGS